MKDRLAHAAGCAEVDVPVRCRADTGVLRPIRRPRRPLPSVDRGLANWRTAPPASTGPAADSPPENRAPDHFRGTDVTPVGRSEPDRRPAPIPPRGTGGPRPASVRARAAAGHKRSTGRSQRVLNALTAASLRATGDSACSSALLRSPASPHRHLIVACAKARWPCRRRAADRCGLPSRSNPVMSPSTHVSGKESDPPDTARWHQQTRCLSRLLPSRNG